MSEGSFEPSLFNGVSLNPITYLMQIKEKGNLSKFPLTIIRELLTNLFLNLCGLTYSVTEIIELASANLTVTDNLDVLYVRGMEREYSLNANAVSYASDGKCLGYAAASLGNDSALEHLDSLSVALANVH